MASVGFAGRVPTRREPASGSITVSVRHAFKGGVTLLATSVTFPDHETYEFAVPESRVQDELILLSDEIDATFGLAVGEDQTRSNFSDIGARLAGLLLKADDDADSADERRRLAKAFQRHPSAPIHYVVYLPIPIELLHFEETIGGVGAFSNFLGGRPNAFFARRSRPGRAVGEGASFFHDVTLESVENDSTLRAIQQSFGSAVEKHHELVEGEKVRATTELNRLWDGVYTWAHFQCHAEYTRAGKLLCLTRSFMVGPDRFRTGGRYLSAIFLNCCRATEMVTGAPPTEGGLQSSWGEHFLGDTHVPVVIGPFCSLEDERTLPFSEAFYAAMAMSDDIYESFVAAKTERLATGDCAALIYRYVGQRRILLPAGSRPSPSDLRSAA